MNVRFLSDAWGSPGGQGTEVRTGSPWSLELGCGQGTDAGSGLPGCGQKR